MPSIQNTDLLTKYSQRDLSFAGIPTTNLQGYWKLNGNANDESTNSYNLTANGSPTYTAGIFDNAVTLNGSSQYLSIADASCLNLEISTSQSWSVWIKPDTSPSTYSYRIINKGKLTLPNNRHEISLGTDDKVTFWLGGLTTNFNVISSNTVEIGKWNYIAGVYDSSSSKLKVFVNGIKTEVTASGTVADSDANFLIGASSFGSGDTPAQWFDGQIDDVAIYNTALTDEQIRVIYNTGGSCLGYWKFNQSEDTNTKLLLHFNGTDGQTSTLDSAGKLTATFVGNAQLDTSQKKFGVSSLLLDGTGDYITLADSTDWHFGSGDFTIDLWVRFNDLTDNQQFANQYVDANNFWTFYKNTNNGISFYVRQSSVDEVLMSTGNNLVTTNNWYHIAMVRDGANCKIFIDGESKTLTGTDFSTTTLSDLATTLKIGYLASGNEQELNGWVDELRIVKGVAKYTANFTPPTEPYSFFRDNEINNDYSFNFVNGPIATTGVFDEAIEMEASSSSYGYIATSEYNDSQFSISSWIKLESDMTLSAIFSRWDSVGGVNLRTYFIYLGTTNIPTFRISSDGTDAGANNATATTALSLDTWHHITGTYDGANIKIYVNGVLEDTTAHTGVKSSPTNRVGLAAIVGRSGDTPVSYYDGDIDDLAYFNRALTAEEVYQIYLGFTPKISIIE